MDESNARLHSLRDEALPALPSILGPGAAEMLGAAVEPNGGRLASARLSQVSWSPRRGLYAVFQARVAWSAGRRPVDEHLVAATGKDVPEGTVQLEDAGGARISLWRPAQDPSLPGLALAMDTQGARALLDGIDVAQGPVSVQLRAYRPTRRAVVELTTRKQRLFVKLVPPTRVAALQALHAGMSDRLPVPRSHGWSADRGLVVLQALPGVGLRKALLDNRLGLPEPGQISALLDLIPAPPDGRSAASQAAGAAGLAPLLRMLVPEDASLIDGLLEAFAADRPSRPEVPVHGDLHEAQMTVQGGQLAGLLDIDTAGLGERIDDWATLLGHLAVLAQATPAKASRINAYAQRVMALADQQAGDPVRLRTRIAAVIFGLASGPFRVQAPGWLRETRRRLSLAETWLQDAHKHEGANMRTFSGVSKEGLMRR